MAQILAHLLGDFCFQNQLISDRKPVSSAFAAVHVCAYTLFFCLLTDASAAALLVIGGTHFTIDRFQLARHWVEFYGVGCEGAIVRSLRERGYLKIDTVQPAPAWLATILRIVVDNTFHLLINYAALAWL